MARYNEVFTPGRELLGKETVGYDQEVEDKYTGLISRRHELNLQLGSVNGETDKILVNLGELVASGKKYKKQTDRLAVLRSESEALNEGIRYLNNQCDLLKRMNTWLTVR